MLFQEPLPASRVHNFGVCLANDLHGRLSGKYSEDPVEIFPKQNGSDGRFGNFLSMPWFGAAVGNTTDRVVTPAGVEVEDQLRAVRAATRHTLDDIEEAIDRLGKQSELNTTAKPASTQGWVAKALREGATEGHRNADCARLAGHFLRKGSSLDETSALLATWAEKCTPPFDVKECDSTVRGIYRQYGETKGKVSISNRLLAVAEAHARSFFQDKLSQPFADIGVPGRSKVVRIESGEFRDWLSHLGWGQLGQAISARTVGDVAATLAAKAKFDGPVHSLAVRVAKQDEALLYDLGEGRAARIVAGEWSLVDVDEPTFERFAHQNCQVDPDPAGDVLRLFEFVPITDPDEQLLLLAYLVSCLDAENPHVVLGATGDQGSGKSSACKVLKRLIDPSEIETLGRPRKEDDLIQVMSHHWWLCVDNLSTMPGWLSDCLCRASTGEGFAKRKLYTDQDDVVFRYKRCVTVNGIAPGCWGADLLDRSLLFQFERIATERRRTEKDFWSEFDRALPAILGGMFSLAANAMANKPGVEKTNLPRMADFAVWGRAVARALGKSEEDFDRAFAANIQRQNRQALDASPVALAVLHFMQHTTEWVGTPTQLMAHLDWAASAAGVNTRDPAWPGGVNWLWPKLQEVRPNLQAEGITVDRGKGADRFIRLEQIQYKAANQTPSERPEQLAILVDDDMEFKRDLEAQQEFCDAMSDEELAEFQTCAVMPNAQCEGRAQV